MVFVTHVLWHVCALYLLPVATTSTATNLTSLPDPALDCVGFVMLTIYTSYSRAAAYASPLIGSICYGVCQSLKYH